MKTLGASIVSSEKKIDIYSENAANAESAAFKNVWGLVQSTKSNRCTASNNRLDAGPGSFVAGAPEDFSQGEIKQTNVSTHYAIWGDGFFKVLDPETEKVYYTRLGDFEPRLLEAEPEEQKPGANAEKTAKEEEPRGNYCLGTPGGLWVLDEDGKRIKWDPDNPKAKLPVAAWRVERNDKMRNVGGGLYLYEGSDEPKVNKDAEIDQGSVECSNVDTTAEMVKMAQSKANHGALNSAFRAWAEGQEGIASLINSR